MPAWSKRPRRAGSVASRAGAGAVAGPPRALQRAGRVADGDDRRRRGTGGRRHGGDRHPRERAEGGLLDVASVGVGVRLLLLQKEHHRLDEARAPHLERLGVGRDVALEIVGGLCGGFCFIVGPGHVRHIGGVTFMKFGELDGRSAELEAAQVTAARRHKLEMELEMRSAGKAAIVFQPLATSECPLTKK